jgi:hypothetical protein
MPDRIKMYTVRVCFGGIKYAFVRFTVMEAILMCFVVLLCLLLIHTAGAQFPTDLSHFDYDSNTELNAKELSVVERNGVMIHELTYTSPRGGAVPAYVVVPGAKGKFAGIVWGIG